MQIKILGSSCSNCQKLEDNTKKAIGELKIAAQVEKITDIEKIMSYGIMSLPAIIVDEKIMSYGSVLGVDEIKKLLTNVKTSSGNSSENCCCRKGCC